MGVTNLDGSQDDIHVKNIAEFAIAAVETAGTILIDEEDPKKGYLRIRVGFHSGSVVSNVIGTLNPRYGLFGETGESRKLDPGVLFFVCLLFGIFIISYIFLFYLISFFFFHFISSVNTASKMESNSYSRKIQCSDKSAKLLAEQAPDIILTKRGKIGIKGKGDMTTYWVGNPSKAVGASAEKDLAEGDPHVEFSPESFGA